MWRALVIFIGLLLAAGAYVLVADGLSPRAAAMTPTHPTASSFGFALAAGAIALAAVFLVSRPRLRLRR